MPMDDKQVLDAERREAYMEATYCVEASDRGVIRLKIDQASSPLDELLQQNNATSWAFITAFNPASVILSPDENAQRQAELKTVLQSRAYRCFSGEGVDDKGRWTPERSLLVLDIEREAALDIAREFGQAAIVYGQIGSVPELLWC